MNPQKMQKRRSQIAGKTIIGIDPAKGKHQAAVIDANGLPVGKPFSFKDTYSGYHQRLHRQIDSLENFLFAIETSCNLWQRLAHHLHNQGHKVVQVSPMATHHSRPSLSGAFSRTDVKDAFLIAMIAWQGNYIPYRTYSDEITARHELALTYDKIRKTLQQQTARLRALLERVFPELLTLLRLDMLTARYLLRRYLLPAEYLELDLAAEAKALRRISRNQHGLGLLEQIQKLAGASIALHRPAPIAAAERLAAHSWLDQIELLEKHANHVSKALIASAWQTPYMAPLVSLKGISDLLAALFIAEIREPDAFTHYKQIEKMAGYDLFVNESGRYRGRRRITHLGNPRLRWILYRMVSETVRYVPEVRLKYLRRKKGNRQKRLIACIPKMLELMMVLLRERRAYRPNVETQLALIKAEDRQRAA